MKVSLPNHSAHRQTNDPRILGAAQGERYNVGNFAEPASEDPLDQQIIFTRDIAKGALDTKDISSMDLDHGLVQLLPIDGTSR